MLFFCSLFRSCIGVSTTLSLGFFRDLWCVFVVSFFPALAFWPLCQWGLKDLGSCGLVPEVSVRVVGVPNGIL